MERELSSTFRNTLARAAIASALVACGVGPPSSSQAPSDHADAESKQPPLAPTSSTTTAASPVERATDDAGAAPARAFTPPDVGPLRAADPDEDGRWAPVDVANDRGARVLWKTVLHPDKARPSAELFVVAIDLSRVRLDSVAGESEPATEVAAAKGYARSGVVPATAQGDVLIAAFNGGWKGEHGHYGIKVDGVTLVKPREGACTVAAYDDDSVRIAPWADLAGSEPRMRLFRQTPPCLVAKGVRHPGLAVETTTNWGAAANGDPIIRRSAIGLGAARDTLFVAVSNAMTAPAIADGMRHVGAHDVAELDVNWSFPRFAVFRRNAAGALEAESLFAGFVVARSAYVRQRSARDFFYLTRR